MMSAPVITINPMTTHPPPPLIAEIEAAKDAPRLVGLENFIANASKGNPKKEKSNQ
jgi:hypothetical protein